ncbi:MAG: metalloregulator ArsR/SmtB family transcription factor [Pseudomonadota bacterium]
MNASVQSTFRALADPSRRMMLVHLSQRDMTIAEVAERFDMTRAAVKKHLTILEQGALISVHPKGRTRVNRLEAQALKPVSDWLDYFHRFWDQRLDKLQQAIEQERTSS